MKLKKLLLGFVVAILSVVSIAFAACSNNNNDKDDDKTGPVTISYQLGGVMDGEDLDSFSFAKGAFWLKLMSDGSVVMDRYSFGNYNKAPAAENKDYVQNYMQGEWEETTRDGVKALSIEIYMLNDAGIKTQTSSGTAYERNGTYTCSLRLEVVTGAGFYRSVEFSGGTTLYADADDFIQKNAKEFVAPESVATFTDEELGGTVYLQKDGKALIYNGYSLAASGTWANDGEGNMTLDIGDDKIKVTVDKQADTAKFSYKYSLYGSYSIDFTFTAKYSDIPVQKAAEVADNVYKGTYDGGQMAMSLTLTITDKTNATLVVTVMANYAPSFNCTYVLEDGVITLTCDSADGNAKMVWDGLPHTWRLNDADHSMTAVVSDSGEQA